MGLEKFFLSYYVKYDLIWLYYNTCLNLINLIFSKLGGHLGIQNGGHKHKILQNVVSEKLHEVSPLDLNVL